MEGARGGGKNDQRIKRFRVHPSLDTLKCHRVDVYDSLGVSAKRHMVARLATCLGETGGTRRRSCSIRL